MVICWSILEQIKPNINIVKTRGNCQTCRDPENGHFNYFRSRNFRIEERQYDRHQLGNGGTFADKARFYLNFYFCNGKEENCKQYENIAGQYDNGEPARNDFKNRQAYVSWN